MEIRNSSKQSGYTLIELLIALAMFSIVLGVLATAFATSLKAARDQQSQALLNDDLQVASKSLDTDIRQTGFLLAAATYSTLPLYTRSSHPISAVEILDDGQTLRCIRLADESGGRLLQGIQPVGQVTDASTEITISGNSSNLTSRIGSSRAFIFISEGVGRKGKIFVTDSAPTVDGTTPNVVHLHGAFTTFPCLFVEDSGTTVTDYRGTVAIPVSAVVDYRFEADGLFRYEYLGSANPCGNSPTVFTKKILLKKSNFSSGSFSYLRADGNRVLPLDDVDFPKLKGVLLRVNRQVRTGSPAEVPFGMIPFILNDVW